ncbi:MAG: prepilin-type N-terminal cleavage/methylation domain-containing protein [Hydrogenophaga sp.]|nr:prepilin-type N-terminal cleavage/methylation domain-containing protein [Hydrogenophaga sp.]
MRPRGFTLVEMLVAIAVMAVVALLGWRAIDGMQRGRDINRDHAAGLQRLQAATGQWTADLDALIDTGEIRPIDFDGRVLRLTRNDALQSRLDSEGLRVVAWARRDSAGGSRWMRWQSEPVRSREALARAWQAGGDWGRGGQATEGVVDLLPLTDWQIYFHRGGSWTNPQSSIGNETPASASSASTAASAELPAGLPPDLAKAARAAAEAVVNDAVVNDAAPLVSDEAPPAASSRTNASVVPDGVRLVLDLGPGLPQGGRLRIDWVRPTLEAAR